METVVVNRPFENDIEAMVAFCRTMKSREAWPGAVPSYASGDTLIYNVGMRLSAAAMTDIEIDEKMDELKARKRALADSLYDREGRISSALTEEDVAALFEA